MAQPARSRRSDSGSGVPIAAGATTGAVAYVLNYVVTFAFVMVENDGGSFDTSDYLFEVVGWVMYNAHFVSTESSASGGRLSASGTANLLAEAPNLTIPRPVWTLAVIVVLVVAGYVVAGRSSGSGQVAGAAVAVGYLPLAVAGTFVFRVSRSGFGTSVTVGPETFTAVALVGVAFPVICGAIGGMLNSGGDL